MPTTERYPARVLSLKAEIPKRPGYYWWKESSSMGCDTEIVLLEDDLKCFYRMADDRPNLIDDGDAIGLFGHEVVGPHAIKETQEVQDD